jgi:hypothetical protein
VVELVVLIRVTAQVAQEARVMEEQVQAEPAVAAVVVDIGAEAAVVGKAVAVVVIMLLVLLLAFLIPRVTRLVTDT